MNLYLVKQARELKKNDTVLLHDLTLVVILMYTLTDSLQRFWPPATPNSSFHSQ